MRATGSPLSRDRKKSIVEIPSTTNTISPKRISINDIGERSEL